MLDGEPRRDVRLILKDDDVKRLRLGYVCLKCLEPHQTPFPKLCKLCGYAMRERQSFDFSATYGGTEHVGPSTSVDEEIERMREDRARENHNPQSSIWLPSNAKT